MAGLLLVAMTASGEARTIIARGAESYGPVTPILTPAMSDVAEAMPWIPGDPIREVPRRFYPVPGQEIVAPVPGLPDPLLDVQLHGRQEGAPSITVGVNIDGQGFTGATPPDTVGDVGPNHYVQAVNASRIAVYDKTGAMLPGFPIDLDSLAPAGHACGSGFGDPIVLYDWLADRWFLQEFTGGGLLCIYISATADAAGSYHFYSFSPPSFPDYPHFGVWPDAYYGTTNEDNSSGPQTTYAFDRANMLAGNPATMQRLAVVAPLSGYGFQTLTPADHDGATPPPAGAPGIFMRHVDDEAHSGSPVPADDYLEIYEMTVDWTTPANTSLATLTPITITDFNSWFVNYSTFFSVPQPSSGTLLDPIREAIMNRLAYRNFGSHEVLVGTLATNRNPATSGSNVQAGNRWFELRRTGGPGNPWVLHQEGTFGGDTNSPDANFFMGSVAMDGAGDIALGYSQTDVSAASPIFPSLGFAGRLDTDTLGTLGPENIAALGVQSQSGSGRWGDYAAMSIDPADDCTFWLTNEYMPGGSWGTRITSFVFQECLFGFVLSPTPAALDVCAPTDPDPTFDIDVTSVGGWSFTVDLSATGEPPGTTSTFVPDNQLPDFTSTYSLLGTGGSTSGQYAIVINGVGGDAPPTERSTQITLNLAVADPGQATLTSPANGVDGVSLAPTLSWSAASDAASYDVEIATDPGFTDVVYTATGIAELSHTVASPLDSGTAYHWRVTSNNVCGSLASDPSSFTTAFISCQVIASSDVPKLIPESGTQGSTTSTLTVAPAAGGILSDVNVLGLVGTHTYMGDLDFFLESPLGTSVQLLEQACGSAENFDLNLDDEAAPGSPPCPPTDGGTYQPASPLAALGGEDSTGLWTLTVVDNLSGDSGQLDGWSLELCREVDATIFEDGFESGTTDAWTPVNEP